MPNRLFPAALRFHSLRVGILASALLATTFASSTVACAHPPERYSPGTLANPVTGAPPLELSGYDWAENLDFDANGNLYVSDTERGEIWRVYLAGNTWTQELYHSGESSVGGLATDSTFLYATSRDTSGRCHLLRLLLNAPGAPAVVLATFPSFANGLEFDQDGTLYATTEGNFLPGTGKVYHIQPDGSWEVFVDDLWAADGIAIDRARRLLYVTQVVNNKVLIYQLSDGTLLKTLSVAPKGQHSLLDDIALDASGENLYGADFGRGEILKIPVNGAAPTVVLKGLQAPTSLLFGRGPTFNPGSLYITEGGGLTEVDDNQRVLEWVVP